MADIANIRIGGTTYSLKDTEARTAIGVLQTTVASSLVFKGIITSATELTTLTNYKLGWTYKVTEAFTIANIGIVEPGDMIVCINSNSTYNASDWTVVQNNVDVMTGASTSVGGARGLVPAPAVGDNEKFLCGDGTWQSPSVWGNFSDLI